MNMNIRIEFKGSLADLRDTFVKEAIERAEAFRCQPNNLSAKKVAVLLAKADALRAFAGWMERIEFPDELTKSSSLEKIG